MSDDKNLPTPWLDSNGAIHSDKVLRETSRAWDLETWDRFLIDTVEGAGSYVREDQISPWAYDAALDEMMESIWEGTSSTELHDLCGLVRRFIRDHLSPRQQHIIRLIFWDGFSERRIAEALGIDRSTVAVQKRRSLKKLKDLIEKRTSFPRLSERATRKSASQERTRDEQIREVYQEEINNVYGKFGGG